MFRAGQDFPPSVQLEVGDWIVNAAGAIPQRALHHDDAGMVRANALLPYELAEVCWKTGARMVHFTTDCVFLGNGGRGGAYNHYRERDVHDATSLYARTKSLGEVLNNKSVFNLRCSVIGPEPEGRSVSLMEWFLRNSPRVVVGYGDHFWNGVTTLAISKVIRGMILNAEDLGFGQFPRVHHLVPKGQVSKAGLLRIIAKEFDSMSKVNEQSVGVVDRTLGTDHHKLNSELWSVAGYEKPPTIEEMVSELARWVGAGDYPFKLQAKKGASQ